MKKVAVVRDTSRVQKTGITPLVGGRERDQKMGKTNKKRLNRKVRQRYLKKLYKLNLEHNCLMCTDYNCIICAKTHITNLSRTLTESEIILLNCGLLFL